MSAPSPPPPAPMSLATRLADLYTALALAGDESEILAAVGAACEVHGVHELRLLYLVNDERGRPREGEVVARWPGPATPGVIRRVAVGELPFAHLWLRSPDQPQWIADLDADAHVDPATRARLPSLRAVALVPLRDERLGALQGVLLLGWHDPHPTNPEEQFFIGALVRAVTSAVTARRTAQGHADALAETSALYTASAALNQVDSIPALLAVLGESARSYGALAAWLLTLEDDPDGRPAALTLAAAWPGEPPAPHAVGRRFPADLPIVDLWRRDGLVPLYFSDLTEDRRLDPRTRAFAADLGVRGAVALPLSWRGRWTGVVALAWSAPHAARAGEQRLYTALARQAAVVLDNRLLLAQAQRSLVEQRREHTTLATLLDNLPVGVFVSDAATGQNLLLNRTGLALVGELANPGVFHVGSEIPVAPEEWTTVRTARTARPTAGEFDLVRVDGSRATVDTTSVPLFDDRGALVRVISVFTDVGEQRRSDAERARLQDDLVRAQADALAERGAPLIPISDEILVLPVVGTVDEARGQQILEALVGLGGRSRVRAVVLDLTGVRDLDVTAADALLGAARALRLRGVVPILTGLQPAAAVALTDIDAVLHGVLVCATVQDAVARAAALARARPVFSNSKGAA